MHLLLVWVILLTITNEAVASDFEAYEKEKCMSYMKQRYSISEIKAQFIDTSLKEVALDNSAETYTLVLSIIATESAFKNKAVSSANARGLMQLTDIAVEEVKVRYPKAPKYFPFNIRSNLWYGVRYLHSLTEVWGKIVGLAHYNGGWRQADKLKKGRPLVRETANYLNKVLYLQERCTKGGT